MRLFRFGVTPVSAMGTQIRSDTLAGHLLCLYRERQGEKALLSLIGKMREGQVPFALSDAVPRGYLPVPMVPPMVRKDFRELVDQLHGGDMLEGLRNLKNFRKRQSFLSIGQWEKVRDDVSSKRLYLLLQGQTDQSPGTYTTELTLHNTINRESGAVLRGALYVTRDHYYPSGGNNEEHHLDVYAQVEEEFDETFRELLDDLQMSGYGRDRSTGKGQIELGPMEPMEGLSKQDGANRWLNLSTYSNTNGNELAGGSYQLETKFGKVWNGFGEKVPFKQPLMVFKSGSTFPKRPSNPGQTVIGKIHSGNPDIVQCCTPVMLPFNFKEGS